MARALFIAVVMLFASQLAFSEYVEKIEVRVLDQMGRVVQGAEVSATYEISKSRGSFTTKPTLTNERGRVSLTLYNVEFLEEDTNYAYTLHAKFGPSQTSSAFEVGKGEYPRTVYVDAYYATIAVVDRYGQPLQADIELYSQKKSADSFGRAVFAVPSGGHTVTVHFGELTKTKDIVVSQDGLHNVSVVLFTLTARAIDDNGNPIQADFYVGPMQKSANEEGVAVFENVSDDNPVVTAYFGRFRKVLPVDPSQDSDVTIAFDTHPPTISDVQSEWRGRFLQVRAVVDDEGTHASGLRVGDASVRLFYITINGTEKEVPMYSIGYNLYEGLAPATGYENNIKYSIVAVDADGNKRTSEANFVVPREDPAPGGKKSEPPIPGIDPRFADASNLPYVIGIAVVLIVIAFALYHFRDQLPLGGSRLKMPPPPTPPTPPIAR